MTVAWVMIRPFRTYATLAAESPDAEDAPTVVGGVLRLLFVLAATIAFTATGRLAPFELGSAMISFAYVPLVEVLAVAAVLRVFARGPNGMPFTRAYALYLVGLGPWLLFFVFASALCLFTPNPSRAFPVLGIALVVADVWGIVLTCAWLKRGLGLGALRTAGAMLLFYVVVHAIVLGYYLAAGQLRPILPL